MGNEAIHLGHRDMIAVADRRFRWEYPDGKEKELSNPESPFMTGKEVPVVKSPGVKTPKSTPKASKVSKSPGFNKSLAATPKNTPQSTKKRKSPTTALEEENEAKRKRVSFGHNLSPEYFDKYQPPSTPVRRGTKPGSRRASLDLFDSPRYPNSAKKGVRMSLAPTHTTISEEGADTPSKSLLRRRSPTPIKPWMVKTLGMGKKLSIPSVTVTPSTPVAKENLTSNKSPGRPKTPKSPGKPSKTLEAETNKPEKQPKTPESETKKSPGRPPKTPEAENKKSPGKPPKTPEAETKKSPGRPPKTPEGIKSPADTPKTPEAEVKKSPGRPPKTPEAKTPNKTPGKTPDAKTPKKTPGKTPKTPE